MIAVLGERPLARRLVSGSRYIAVVGFGQILAFVAGILIVRSMPKTDYAAYTAAMAAVAAAVVVSDSGTGSVLMARLARLGDSPEGRAESMRAALATRRTVSLVVLAVLGTALLFVLVQLRLPVVVVVVVVGVVAVIVFNTLLRSIFGVDAQVQRRYLPLAAVDTVTNALRAALAALLALAALRTGWALTAFILLALAASILQTRLTRRLSAVSLQGVVPDVATTRAFNGAVRATLPWTALMFSGEQLINLLLTAFGNGAAIAEIGALTRYGMAFLVVNALIGNVVTTEIAHAAASGRRLIALLGAVLSGGLVIAAGYVLLVWVFRTPLLGLLGPQYAHLDSAFFVLSVASALQFVGAYVLGAFVHARGWVRGNWIYGPFLGLWVAWAVVVVQPRDALSASWVFLGLQVPTLISQFFRILVGLRGRGGTAA